MLELVKILKPKFVKLALMTLISGVILADLLLLVSGMSITSFASTKLELTLQDRLENQSKTELPLPRVNNSPRIEKIIAEKEKQAEEAAKIDAIPQPNSEVKKKITAVPPVQSSSSGVVSSTTVNTDGSQTTVISEGSVDQSEFSQIASLPNTPDTPLAVTFKDETGVHADLETPLLSYLNSTLKWGSEISSLRTIILKDAGESGWSGQYNGSYTVTKAGDITEAFGWITLNVYYYKDKTELTDYMKLVLSHEYGHHYTLYHKWVDADLPEGTRFPDSYYSIRPLSKDSTTTDCSSSWSTCEPEIIAEDYSYIYSGYGYHAMKSTLDLPSASTKTWLDNITDSLKNGVAIDSTPTPLPNQPPTLEITAPANGSNLGQTFTFAVRASDDKSVDKVVFSRDDTVLLEDKSAPYETAVDLSGLTAGNYSFKAKAFDSDGATAERSFSLTITQAEQPSDSPPQSDGTNSQASQDSEKPAVTFIKPETNPYNWTSGNLTIRVQGTDNVAVTKIELFINDTLVATEDAELLSRRWNFVGVPAGEYTLKAKAYDAAGNLGEATLLVQKSS